ncbi:MAG: FkbM family methyltransferase [Bacteroidales bacterium]|jgi:FkbM family methyltransferase|nr:FkbM family methyltransferase [Bacteroidales bacterium]
MTLKDYVNDARVCHYSLGTFVTGIVSGGLSILSKKFKKFYYETGQNSLNKYLVYENGLKYYNIKGVKVSEMPWGNFNDILCVYCYYNDDYSKEIVEKFKGEGTYCYKDIDIDVTIKEGDVVIDAGASVGEFCAYTAYKKALCYAFEPTESRYEKLCVTANLNSGKIIPVKMGLSDSCSVAQIVTEGIASPSMVLTIGGTKSEEIELITLDQYVNDNNIAKVDFIKSDIEGAERQLLRGATNVLKTFAPKLSICTYHLPDDPEVLAEIILTANPKYKIAQGKSKLYAAIP